MDTKELMSGIAVVIDDAVTSESAVNGATGLEGDLINRIIGWFEREWGLPFVKSSSLPPAVLWPNLFQAASFVLLDWRLWPLGSTELREQTIQEVIRFLECARKCLVPVFIFTNDDPENVTDELPEEIYQDPQTGRNFVFVERKDRLWVGDEVDVGILESWVHGNASVYTLRTWDKVLASARNELFRSMSEKSVDWPRVFWKASVDDGAEPSASLTSLINDSLGGRMHMGAFEEQYLGGESQDVSGGDLRGLIAETSFRLAEFLPEDEIRCGDVYKRSGGKYWLNLRPDCDCIPRSGEAAGDIEVHCIKGRKLGIRELRDDYYNESTGNFRERVYESVVFAIVGGRSVVFSFKNMQVMKYSAIREKRVGRLLHPYLTRIQQRYALYIQRQALPRVPESAVETPSQ